MTDANSERLKILLVEDDVSYAFLIEEYLKDSTDTEFVITHVTSLHQAMATLEKDDHQLVLLDLGLPDSFGMDTLISVRKKYQDIPVVVLTGNDDEATGRMALREGAQDYLIKTDPGISYLDRSLKYAIERMYAEKERRLAEDLKNRLDAQKAVTQELERLNMMKDEFIETVTHELRTPLTVLNSSIESLIDGTLGSVNEGQQAFLEMMGRNIHRLVRFSTNVLTLSKFDSTAFSKELQPFQLDTTLSSELEMMQAKAEQQGHHLSFNELKPVHAFGDADGMCQIVTNLVNNAIMHTPEGTKIKVSSMFLDEHTVRICVEDDGVGIDEEKLEMIFERFSQVDREPGPGYKGIGLGLAVCKGLVAMMGGQISVESAKGTGTRFLVDLPTTLLKRGMGFGNVAEFMGVITLDQIRQAVHQQKEIGEGSPIGEICISMGFLSSEARDRVLQVQSDIFSTPHPLYGVNKNESLLGSLGVRLGYIDEEQLHEALRLQQERSEAGESCKLGDVLVDKEYLLPSALDSLVAMQGELAISAREIKMAAANK